MSAPAGPERPLPAPAPARGVPPARRRRGWWAFASLLPFGWGTWIGFLIASAAAPRKRLWAASSVFWLATAALPWIVQDVIVRPADPEDNTLAGLLLFAHWGAGIVASFLLRPRWEAEVAGVRPPETAAEAARRRMAERAEAQRLARRDPVLALEMGLGRPDLPGAAHHGVVDVNHAGVEAFRIIPGMDRQLAERIVAAREELGGRGFSSALDLASVVDLPPHLVDDVERHTVYLPRT